MLEGTPADAATYYVACCLSMDRSKCEGLEINVVASIAHVSIQGVLDSNL